MNGRRRAADSRVLLLALALEATPAGVSRLARFGRQKSAFVATLVAEPGDYGVMGFLPTESGLDVLWRRLAGPRLARGGDAG
jgi:hypothetical protein